MMKMMMTKVLAVVMILKVTIKRNLRRRQLKVKRKLVMLLELVETAAKDTLRVGNQQVRVTAHPTACAENDEYGLMFRGSVDAEFKYSLYLFTLRCGGAARFLLIRGTETTVLADWTPAPAAQLGAPADNTLMVWMAGGEFRFYVNDQYLFTAADSTLTDGFYGLYLSDRTAGGETVYFEDLIARAVNK